jgi:hypothetical protein
MGEVRRGGYVDGHASERARTPRRRARSAARRLGRAPAWVTDRDLVGLRYNEPSPRPPALSRSSPLGRDPQRSRPITDVLPGGLSTTTTVPRPTQTAALPCQG